jgi:hypothetical protein
MELQGHAIVEGRDRLARNSGHFIPRTIEHLLEKSGTIGMNSRQETVNQLPLADRNLTQSG